MGNSSSSKTHAMSAHHSAVTSELKQLFVEQQQQIQRRKTIRTAEHVPEQLHQLPYELVMHIMSFVDRRTLLFSVALSSRHMFFLSKMCHKKFVISPLSLFFLALEKRSLNELPMEEGNDDNMWHDYSSCVGGVGVGGDGDQQQKLSMRNAQHQFLIDDRTVTLQMVIDALCESEWRHWFSEVSFAVSRNVSEVLRTVAVSKDRPHAASKYQFAHQVSCSHLQQLAESCTTLTSINLNGCYHISNGCGSVLASFTMLKKLNIISTSISSEEFGSFVHHFCPRQYNSTLEEIQLGIDVGWDNIKLLIHYCPKLTHLHIHFPAKQYDKMKPVVNVQDWFPSIRTLQLSGKIPSYMSNNVGKMFPELLSLRLQGDSTDNLETNLLVPELVNRVNVELRELEIQMMPSVPYMNLITVLNRFPLITSIVIQDIRYPWNTALRYKSCNVHQIQTLKLGRGLGCSQFFAQLADNCTSLRVLDIDGQQLSLITQICHTATNLESLTIRSCSINDGDIGQFIQALAVLSHLTRLELVDISEYESLLTALCATDRALKARLQYLTLRQLDAWSDESITRFFLSLPAWQSLHTLDMRQCFTIRRCTEEQRCFVRQLVRVLDGHAPFVVLHSLGDVTPNGNQARNNKHSIKARS